MTCVCQSLWRFSLIPHTHTHTHTVAINCDEWLCLRVALTWMKGKRDRCVQEGEERGKPVDTDHFAAITRDVALHTWCTKKKQQLISPSVNSHDPQGLTYEFGNDSLDTCFLYLTKGVGISLGHAVCVRVCVCAC